MDVPEVIEALRQTARTLTNGSDLDQVRAIQTAQDALDAAKAVALGRIAESKAYELEGASTLGTWTRNELRLTTRDATALQHAATTLAQLPLVAEAAAAGRIRIDHVNVFTYGIKHTGAEVISHAQPWLVDLATKADPAELHKVVRALHEAVFPDSLDEAWARGMDRQDIQVQQVAGGWHVTGFLNITAGRKFKAVLDSVSAPRDKDDRRSGSARRVQGLDDLCTTILESGLPSDKGVMPQLSVHVDADTLQHQLGDDHGTTGTPAVLTGFGPIGPAVLGMIACNADVTPVLMRNGDVLDVGRSRRLATRKQRLAVLARQHSICAAPGCTHTHLEIHHVDWWSTGGTTNLENLIGLCVRCHHLLHRGLLQITTVAGEQKFIDRDNREIVRGYRQRQAAHRETLTIRRITADRERRRQQPDYWLRA